MKTRRQFIIESTAVAGGFVVGCGSDRSTSQVDPVGQVFEPIELNPYVLVDPSGITIITPRAEMGQGIHTTLAALVAEELEVAFDEIRVEHGPASENYSNTIMYPHRPGSNSPRPLATQSTGGQTSTRDAFVKMRKAGAAAREMLIRAAADRLNADPKTLTARNGAVIDTAGNEILYVELAPDAANIAPPQDPPLKPRSKWKLLGRSLPRVDMREKCTGAAVYGIDVDMPGLLYGAVKRNPRIGGELLDFDASTALEMRGVEGIVPMDDGVIVLATNTWYAFQALDRIEFDWGPAPYPETSADHRNRVERAFDTKPFYRKNKSGDAEKALEDARIIEGSYSVPYLAHATMEPLNATALLKDGRLDIWAGNQFPTLAVLVGARLTGLDREAVKVHTPYMGGGFGRRFAMNDVAAAVLAAKAHPGRPVRVTYSRDEDFTHDTYRPLASARFRASLTDGKPAALDLEISAPSIFASGDLRRNKLTGEPLKGPPKTDVSISMGAADQPYTIENYRVTTYRTEQLLPVGWWRSVGSSQNCFFHESILDEIAHAAGSDPLMMRLDLLKHQPSRRVLESVAEMSNWGSKLPEGRARGVAFSMFKKIPTAAVIEISYDNSNIRLLRAHTAVDVGIALDRRNIEGQVQGAFAFGLSSSIFGEITVSDGAVEQTNFDVYSLLQMRQSPSISVQVLENGGKIRGVGEAATPVAGAALGNAIFAATGQRVRELPFSRHFRFV